MPKKKVRRRQTQELGLGDAVWQLIRVMRSIGRTPDDCVDPRLESMKDQLMTALNTYRVDVGFECSFDPKENLYDAAEQDDEQTPLAVINRGATSSCCRILRSELPGRKRGRG